jgi:hypothetical protein
MIDVRNIEEEHTLENYARYPELTEAVRKFESTVAQAARHLKGRTVWMVNSTAHGGGVAEMLPVIVSLSELATVLSSRSGSTCPRSFRTRQTPYTRRSIRSTTGTASSPYMS